MLKTITKHLNNFFTIDNPLLIATLLLIVVLSRFNATYLNDARRVQDPGVNFYAAEVVGDALRGSVTEQSYRLINRVPMELSVGYGYSFTIIGAGSIGLLSVTGICDYTNHIQCNTALYKVELALVIVGFISLIFLFIKDRTKQAFAFIFLIAFWLGIPGGMGLESGNLDIVLSLLFGIMLYLQRKSLDSRNSYKFVVLLGILSGVILMTKTFFLPLAIIFLIFSVSPLIFLVSFLATLLIITIIPSLFGIPLDLIYPIHATQVLIQQAGADYSKGAIYGNNATRGMVGGIVFMFPDLMSSPLVKNLIINFGAVLLLMSVLLLPVYRYKEKFIKNIKKLSLKDRLNFSFFILNVTYVFAVLVLWPEISLDYRLYYGVPLIFIFLGSNLSEVTKRTLAIALTALAIRSMFIWHARLLHVPLLIFFYFLLTTALLVWLEDQKKTVKKSI